MLVTAGIASVMAASLSPFSDQYMKIAAFMSQLLLKIDPESAHYLAVQAARSGLTPADNSLADPVLATQLWGLTFTNPIGLAAGFDKHGDAMGSMLRMGFSFVEVGTVTPLPQAGNARPRVFRLPEDKAVINRYGFNSEGYDTVRQKLSWWQETPLEFKKYVFLMYECHAVISYTVLTSSTHEQG